MNVKIIDNQKINKFARDVFILNVFLERGEQDKDDSVFNYLEVLNIWDLKG